MPDKQQTGTGPLQKLEAICDEIFERWDKDQRSGKLLSALAGHRPSYRADVTEVREALSGHTDMKAALEKVRSYNVDIKAGRINYRPEDHIAVIDAALSKLGGK